MVDQILGEMVFWDPSSQCVQFKTLNGSIHTFNSVPTNVFQNLKNISVGDWVIITFADEASNTILYIEKNLEGCLLYPTSTLKDGVRSTLSAIWNYFLKRAGFKVIMTRSVDIDTAYTFHLPFKLWLKIILLNYQIFDYFSNTAHKGILTQLTPQKLRK